MCYNYIPLSETQQKSARLGENVCCAVAMLLQLPMGCFGWCLPQTAPQKLSPLLKNIMNRDRNNYLHLPTVIIFHST